MTDEELLDTLRRSVARLRFVTLLAGVMLALWAVLSVVTAIGQLTMMLRLGGPLDLTMGAVLGITFVIGLLTAALDGLGAGLLLFSGVRGLQSRLDPSHLLASVRALRRFWWVAVLRVVVMVAVPVLQALMMVLF